MRGESRLCRGSIEPLRRLPDGALATRRIVFLLCAAAAAVVRLKKACSSPDLAKLSRGHAAAGGAFSWYRRNE